MTHADATPLGLQHLRLSLRIGVEPLSGELAGDGFAVAFEGWLGLAGALERVRAGAASDPSGDPAAGG